MQRSFMPTPTFCSRCNDAILQSGISEGEETAMDASLQQLLDESAIRKVHMRYCRGVDRMDFELIRSCYHPDAIDDHGEYVGGIDGFIEYCKAGTPNFESTTHFTGNYLIDVEGDVAWAEFYARAYHRVPADADGVVKDLVVNTRYVDRWEKRGGEWKIAHRKVVVDTDRVDVVTDRWVPQEQLRARRDKGDPSYQRP
jgi:ketosteroid isomerase-like protein